MTLNEYLKSPGALSLTQLSEKIGISKGRLSQLRTKNDWPADVALRAEESTGGAIDAAMLSTVVARARQGRPACEASAA